MTGAVIAALAAAAGSGWTVGVSGGLEVLGTNGHGLPVVPLPVVDAQVAFGAGEHIELRWRHTTLAGLLHRTGPELRLRAAPGRWSFVGRVRPSIGMYVIPRATAYGGDVSAEIGGIVAYAAGPAMLFAGAGASLSGYELDHTGSRTLTRQEWYVRTADLAAGVEWRRGARGGTWLLRVDLALPQTRADLISSGGMRPSLTFGATWALGG